MITTLVVINVIDLALIVVLVALPFRRAARRERARERMRKQIGASR